MNADFFPFFPSLSRDNLARRMEAWAKLPPEYHSFVQCHLLYVIASRLNETQRSAAQILETQQQMLQAATSLADQMVEMQNVDSEPSVDPDALVKLLLAEEPVSSENNPND